MLHFAEHSTAPRLPRLRSVVLGFRPLNSLHSSIICLTGDSPDPSALFVPFVFVASSKHTDSGCPLIRGRSAPKRQTPADFKPYDTARLAPTLVETSGCSLRSHPTRLSSLGFLPYLTPETHQSLKLIPRPTRKTRSISIAPYQRLTPLVLSIVKSYV